MKPRSCYSSRKCLAGASSLAAILLAASVTARAAPAPATATAAPLPAQLSQLLHRFARAHPSFPGVVLAVTTPKLTWSGAAGVADRATRKPLGATAGFGIASVTKTFTAAAPGTGFPYSAPGSGLLGELL